MPDAQQPAARDQPVTFTADSVEYDRENALVIAQGHVEAWQNDHVLRADQITFDRNTGVAAANGNVVLLEPDGQVLFADYAELTQDMKNGVLRDMRAILARERQAGRQRRATHRRPDQRAVARGLFHLQSLREGSEPGRRCGRSARCRRCRTSSTRRSSTRTPCWRCTASRSAICRISGTPILR